MHLVQKGELLVKIKEKLIKLDKDAEQQKSSEDFKTLIKILGQEDRMDANWDQFAAHFNEVHGDFLLTLKRKFSDLTPNDLKLCAYLRMNMSTKEIAQMMNISVRGVEISRYRLRKKLRLKTSENIFNMLITLKGITETGETNNGT
jgi:DNA-binding CsgD family transcriptional regulator